MANTTNFGWETPDDTDLVKDGAAAIRSLGSAIDSTVFTNAGNAINKTIVDAKGDLIAATAADTVARLAVGTNDQVLMADSSTATGLKWATFSAGGMTQLATGTLSGAALNLTSIAGTYRDLRLVINNMDFATNNDRLRFRFNNNSNSVYSSQTSAVQTNITLDSVVTISQYNNTTVNNLFVMDVYDYANSSTYKMAEVKQIYDNATADFTFSWFMLLSSATAAITELNLLAITSANNTSSFTGGTYTLYGVK